MAKSPGRSRAIATNQLDERQAAFVKLMATTAMTPTACARVVDPNHKRPNELGSDWMHLPQVRIAIASERAKYEAAADITRRKVIDGIVEAIDMARVQADPTCMISGWKEIGKLCGHYEPTKTQLVITFQGRATLDKLERMSDDELLRLSSQEIEGEFTEIGDDTQAT